MALKQPPQPVSMTLNLAPMVDVLMCLIVFFLLASKMVAAEHYPVNLPRAIAAREVEQAELGARVTVVVRPADASGAEAEYVVIDWSGEAIVERVLQPSEVTTLLQGRAARAEREKQKLRCVIRADENIRYEHVEVVLRGCGLAHIADVVFPAESETPHERGPSGGPR